MQKQKSNKELNASSQSLAYGRYIELTSKSKATQKEADRLADEVNKNWWTKNRNRFIKEKS